MGEGLYGAEVPEEDQSREEEPTSSEDDWLESVLAVLPARYPELLLRIGEEWARRVPKGEANDFLCRLFTEGTSDSRPSTEVIRACRSALLDTLLALREAAGEDPVLRSSLEDVLGFLHGQAGRGPLSDHRPPPDSGEPEGS